MLVARRRLHRRRGRGDASSQRQCRRKLDVERRGVTALAGGDERELRRTPPDGEAHSPAPRRHMLDGHAVPVGREMRGHDQSPRRGIDVEPEQPTNQWRQHHRRGEELLRNRRIERLVESTGKHLGVPTERLVEAGPHDRLQREVTCRRVVVAILGQRDEAGDERPDGAVVVVKRIEERAGRVERPGTPIGQDRRRRETCRHLGTAFRGKDVERHRRRGPRRQARIHRAVLQQRKGVLPLCWQPELGLHRRDCLGPHRARLGREGRLTIGLGHSGKAVERGHPHAAEVDVRKDADLQVAHFERPRTGGGILHQAVAILVRRQRPLIRPLEIGPQLLHERHVVGLAPVLAGREDPERRGVAVIEGVGVGKPVNASGTLRDLMGDLPVGALILREEAERAVAHQGALPRAGHRQRIDRRVTAEEPAKAGTISRTTRESIARDQSATEIGIADVRFVEVDLGIFDGAIELGTRRMQCQLRRAQRVGMGHALSPRTFGGTRLHQGPIERERRIAGHGPTGQHDRDVGHAQVDTLPRRLAETRCGVALTGATDADDQLGWRRGEHVRRHIRRLGHCRRPKEGVDRLLPLGEEEGARLLLPDQVLAAEPGGPGIVDVGGKAGDDLERADRVDLEQDDDGWLIEGDEDVLAHGELFVAVLDRHPFGALDHRSCDAPPGDRLGVLGHPEREFEVMEPLDRPRPELEAPVFSSHRDGAATHGREVRPRTCGTGQRQR